MKKPDVLTRAVLLIEMITELKRFITAPDDYLDGQGNISLEIAGCSLLAAPLLLFLLKRRGFSCCRAWAGSTGLALSACR